MPENILRFPLESADVGCFLAQILLRVGIEVLPMISTHHHAAQRWSAVVVAATDATADPRTLEMWAHCAGVSVGALRTWCRAAQTSARASLYFTRMLRALVHSPNGEWDPFDVLDIVDDRTLQAFLLRCGFADRSQPTLVSFFARQRLVLREGNVRAVIETLRNRGITIVQSPATAASRSRELKESDGSITPFLIHRRDRLTQ